jgi:hypothetical protein
VRSLSLTIRSHISVRRKFIVRIFASILIAVAILFGATDSGAAPDARACAAKKNIAAGIYFKCMTKAEAKFDINLAVGNRVRAKRKCAERLERFYLRADNRFGANCATSADSQLIQQDLAAITDKVTQWLRSGDGPGPILPEIECGTNTFFDSVSRTCTGSPVQPPNLCGNGEIDSGEECDFQAFGGVTCDDYGFDRGNLDCAPGCFIDAGNCYDDGNPTGPNRFEVLGDGTVMDNHLGLLFEAKWDPETDRGPISSRDLTFTKGGLTSVFLPVLNDTFSVFDNGEEPLGGCSPWRIPTLDELSSIAGSGMISTQCGAPSEICLPRSNYVYWSSTEVGGDTVGIVISSGMTRILPSGSKERAIGVCDPS